jgi:hypothetical protein
MRALVWLLVLAPLLSAADGRAAEAPVGPLPVDVPVRGFTILSADEAGAQLTIAAARRHGINHLELSHQVIGELRDLRKDDKRALVAKLVGAAHGAGIREVVLWEHALYPLDYYPEEFRTGPDGTLDLDAPAFWDWLRKDYRSMLDLAPDADGVVLTFVETGARAERQHSVRMKTTSEKLAAVVNAIADVVVGERHLNLYARLLSYTHAEFAAIAQAVSLFPRPEIRLIIKDTTHEFYLNHPNDPVAGTIARPTLVEFDGAGEFHGQGVVANTWPESVLNRWRDLSRRPHVIGYTARTDRYGDTHLVGRPGEINLFALHRAAEDPEVTAEQVYDEFITARYGAAAVPHVKPAFKAAFDIGSATFYTLGINTADHSGLSFGPSEALLEYTDTWFPPSVGWIGHGVDREIHYVKDAIDHIAEPGLKPPAPLPWQLVPWVVERGWIHPGEGMDEPTLRAVMTEKDFAVAAAERALHSIEAGKASLKSEDYQELRRYFGRTLLTARAWRATAGAYLGFRTWSRGGVHRTPYVEGVVRKGLAEIAEVAPAIRAFPGPVPVGQWNWRKDADAAERYAQLIRNAGWTR